MSDETQQSETEEMPAEEIVYEETPQQFEDYLVWLFQPEK